MMSFAHCFAERSPRLRSRMTLINSFRSRNPSPDSSHLKKNVDLVDEKKNKRKTFKSTYISKINDKRPSKSVTRLVKTTIAKNSLKSIKPSLFTSIKSKNRVDSSVERLVKWNFSAYSTNWLLFNWPDGQWWRKSFKKQTEWETTRGEKRTSRLTPCQCWISMKRRRRKFRRIEKRKTKDFTVFSNVRCFDQRNKSWKQMKRLINNDVDRKKNSTLNKLFGVNSDDIVALFFFVVVVGITFRFCSRFSLHRFFFKEQIKNAYLFTFTIDFNKEQIDIVA